MIVLSINNNEYKAYEAWKEIPLSLAIEIHKLLFAELPSRLKDIYDIISQPVVTPEQIEERDNELVKWYDSISNEEVIKIFPTFYGKVIALLTDIPAEVIEMIDRSQRDMFYKKYCEKFVFGILHYPADYESKNIKSFTYKDVEYFLPETKEVLGVEKPFFDRTAIEFTECADLEYFSKEMEAGKYEYAANIISIICRPKRNKTISETGEVVGVQIIEPYNEQTSLLRAKEFVNLTMDVVHGVFFCLQKHIILSHQLTTTSILQETLQGLQKLSKKVESKDGAGTQVS